MRKVGIVSFISTTILVLSSLYSPGPPSVTSYPPIFPLSNGVPLGFPKVNQVKREVKNRKGKEGKGLGQGGTLSRRQICEKWRHKRVRILPMEHRFHKGDPEGPESFGRSSGPSYVHRGSLPLTGSTPTTELEPVSQWTWHSIQIENVGGLL